MKLLKNGFVLLIAVSAMMLTACNKDEDCEAPDVSENIVGTWELQLSNGEVEFKSDGTLVDPDDALFGVEVNGVVYDQKTYTISGNTLTVTAMPAGSTDSSSSDFEITQNECDEIKISILGITETMIRK